MAMTFPHRALLLACALQLSCVARPSGYDVGQDASPAIEDPIGRPDLPLILVVMPVTQTSTRLREALIEELAPDMNIVTLAMTPTHKPDLAAAFAEYSPSAVVLVDDRSASLYRNFQKQQPKRTPFPPALVLMPTFAHEVLQSVANASVISYQVPAVTALVELRRVLDAPVRRVGVVYRQPFGSSFKRNQQFARVEHVEMVGASVSRAPDPNELGHALHGLLHAQPPVDALWVLNDNALLTADLLRQVWLPLTHEARIPVVVGVEALVDRRLDFGSLAAIPDIDALGNQAAQYLLELADRDWHLEPTVEPPISVLTVVDAVQAEQFYTLRQGALEGVDRVVR